uniref:Uncharacterized protein n=1 Tax=Myoviridae sp. ctn8H20 TaxID=2825169 RepID=A0A8S5QG63_9CAUD|nr:MAG TPA: hypothetical protein [Myoviridae sp. ctn8H20]
MYSLNPKVHYRGISFSKIKINKKVEPRKSKSNF